MVPLSKDVLVLYGKKFIILVGAWRDGGVEVAYGKRSEWLLFTIIQRSPGLFHPPTKGKVVWLSLPCLCTSYRL